MFLKFFDIFSYQFIQNAIIASLLVSIVCGVIGVIIVEKKLIMMSGGIAHTAYGGVGLAYWLNFSPMIGAMLFSVLAGFGIGYMRKKNFKNQDVFIALMWSLGMSLGILFISFMNSYPPNLTTYLFGDILTVTKSDILIMFILTIIILLIFIMLFNDFKLILFDEEFAKVIGVRVNFLNYLLLIMVALSIVILIRVVGIILVIALLSIPAGTASLYTNKFSKRIYISIILGIIYSLAGLYFSYVLNIASGATIIILSSIVYFVSYTIATVKKTKTVGVFIN